MLPLSEIELLPSVSVTVGASSSSVIVPVPVAVPSVAFPALLNTTFTVSSSSSTVSPDTETSMFWLVSPALNVKVPDDNAV